MGKLDTLPKQTDFPQPGPREKLPETQALNASLCESSSASKESDEQTRLPRRGSSIRRPHGPRSGHPPPHVLAGERGKFGRQCRRV